MLRLSDYEDVKSGRRKRPEYAERFLSSVPEGSSGPWKVERFEIPLDLTNLRMMRDGRGCFPGTYTRLVHQTRGIVMSDTTAEAADHIEPYQRATGRCLIHGLGLGCFLGMILAKPEVTEVDVVEIDDDVIKLVAPHFYQQYPHSRLRIHHGDARTMKWPRGSRWEMVWHDIWDNICADNLPEMQALHRSFGRRCNWQGSWAREWLRRDR